MCKVFEKTILCLFFLTTGVAVAQKPPIPDRDYPIIDVHLHALRATANGPPPQPICVGNSILLGWDPSTELNPNALSACDDPIYGVRTDEELMRRTLEILERQNVVGVTSGPLLDQWIVAAPDRIIPGILTTFADQTPETLRELLESGKVRVLAEVTTQYRGLPPNAEELEPYWALAEELDVPVGIHMGSGPPGMPILSKGRYRAANGNPLLLEDVLAQHPRLRVYVMHSGYPFSDEIIALMQLYPQVYAGIGVIGWAVPRESFHRHLREMVSAGLGQRIMFGSDQMVWPEAIEATIEAVESADYLSREQKRAIFYDNARRFFRLDE